MEFLRSFLRRYLAGKPVVASPNVGCFLRLKDSPFKGGLNVTKNIIGCPIPSMLLKSNLRF